MKERPRILNDYSVTKSKENIHKTNDWINFECKVSKEEGNTIKKYNKIVKEYFNSLMFKREIKERSRIIEKRHKVMKI